MNKQIPLLSLLHHIISWKVYLPPNMDLVKQSILFLKVICSKVGVFVASSELIMNSLLENFYFPEVALGNHVCTKYP